MQSNQNNSKISKNNLFIAIAAIAGVLTVSGITTAVLFALNQSPVTSVSFSNISSSLSSAKNLNNSFSDSLDPNNLNSSQSDNNTQNNNTDDINSTSSNNLPSTNSNNQAQQSINNNYLQQQIEAAKTINPETVTKEEYKEILGKEAPSVEVIKSPNQIITEYPLTFTYSNAGDLDMVDGVLSINLSEELKIKPGSVTEIFGGKLVSLPDSLIDSNNNLSFGPGSNGQSIGKVRIGQRGQVKMTILIGSDVSPGSYRVTSTLKGLNDTREVANPAAVYFIDVI